MSSSEEWEEVSEDGLTIEIEEKKSPRKAGDVKLEYLHRIMGLVLQLLAPVEKPEINEQTDLFIKEELCRHVEHDEENDRNAKLFKYLCLFNIPSRIYFVLSNEVKTFLEVEILGKINTHHRKYSACVFSVDPALAVADQSFHFSTTMKHHSALKFALRGLSGTAQHLAGSEILGNSCFSGAASRAFGELDETRSKEMPRSAARYRKHPLYVMESVLRWNEAIYPKRPLCGYFKGEAVYPRKNVVTLRTREQFYRAGRAIRADRPFRVVKRGDESVRLYAEWQTQDVVVEGMSNTRYQDYFHPNFVPVGCMYVGSPGARGLAHLMGLNYRICFHGFSGRLPVYRGIVIEKKDLYVFSSFLVSYERFTAMRTRNERGLALLKKWRVLVKNASKYLRIRRSLGLCDGTEA
jgi:xeroderma pigmentosum group C-complementing protein